jgi:hypothetical protein
MSGHQSGDFGQVGKFHNPASMFEDAISEVLTSELFWHLH